MRQPIVAAVCVSEADEARAAIALGVGAARLLRAPLVLAGVAVCQAPGGAAVVPGWSLALDPEELRAELAGRLAELATAVPASVHCTVQAIASAGILAGLEVVIEDERAQLLVVGPSHLGSLARAFRGDIAIGAVHHAGCAVLVAPAGEPVTEWWPQTIAVAWDGSSEADTALELATALAQRAGATLRILRAGESSETMAMGIASDPVLLQQAVDVARARAERELREAAAIAAERVPCEPVLLEGQVAAAITAFSAGVDLLVIGARRQGALRRMLLGSVSSAVAHHAASPVLVVPHGAPLPVAG